jgi:hypothetical protein
MARQRASQAHAAFARVGASNVPPSADVTDSISASENASASAVDSASNTASVADAGKARGGAGRKAGGKAGRRVGRPRGPDRVALSVRILPALDDRLTQAVEATGQSPQYLVEAALDAYLTRLGIKSPRPGGRG